MTQPSTVTSTRAIAVSHVAASVAERPDLAVPDAAAARQVARSTSRTERLGRRPRVEAERHRGRLTAGARSLTATARPRRDAGGTPGASRSPRRPWPRDVRRSPVSRLADVPSRRASGHDASIARSRRGGPERRRVPVAVDEVGAQPRRPRTPDGRRSQAWNGSVVWMPPVSSSARRGARARWRASRSGATTRSLASSGS